MRGAAAATGSPRKTVLSEVRTEGSASREELRGSTAAAAVSLWHLFSFFGSRRFRGMHPLDHRSLPGKRLSYDMLE